MPKPVLIAQNAEITTASITIKSLTVDRRQVTMALFRQLISEEIFDWDALFRYGTASLRGVGWGHVRYLIEHSPNEAIHLVWQKGSDLRRCIVPISAPQITDGALICRRGKEKPVYRQTRDGHFKGTEHIYESYGVGYLLWNGKRFTPTGAPGFTVDINEINNSVEANQRIIDSVDKYIETCRPYLDKLKMSLEERRAAYAATVQPLFNLPQLFIAV